MPTTDRSPGLPELELDGPLREAFAFAPPEAASAAAHRRMAAAISLSAAGDGSDRRPSRGFGSRLSLSIGRMSRRTRAVTVLAGVLVLGGAGGGVLGMYEGMVGSQGGARTAWDLATIVGASQTVHGYRVTIDRAYADSNELMLAVSVTDRENRGWTQIGATSMNVTDERGRSFDGTMAMSTPDGAALAANLAWFTSPAGLTAGRHELTVSIPSVSVRDNSTPPPDETPATTKSDQAWMPWHTVAGPWTFTIPVQVHGGSSVRPDVEVTVADMQVRLIEATVSPASVTASVTVTGSSEGQWFPIGQFAHEGRSYPINSGMLPRGAAVTANPEITIVGDGGTDSPSGEWTLRIDELVGGDGPEQVRLQGPWILRFVIP